MINNKKYKAALFDLDGVIVDTAKYHYLAWKRLSNELGIEFTIRDNERLKGVSRVQSLSILLEEIGGLKFDYEEKMALADKKNKWYVEYISQIKESEVLPGAKELLIELRSKGIKIALASASKNASLILNNLNITDLLDTVIDGNMVINTKPDPEVFILGAKELKIDPIDCVVFEDSLAGIQAAKTARMYAVGIGKQELLEPADLIMNGFEAFDSSILF